MTVPEQEVHLPAATNDKELNFRQLEAKYQRQLEQERQARAELEKQLQQKQVVQDDDDDDEPYVDKRKLQKHLAKFGEQTQKQTQSEIQKAVQTALNEERKQNWIKSNPDFYDVVEKHAEQFAIQDPELAETILSMPNNFERQKLVYRNIKALGLDKPKQPEPSIQQKIDANRRSPYYQPSQMGTAPYSNASDFSPQGQKQAYDKMQQLKNAMRLGG